jgi:uncharacterized membrane protein
MTDPRRRGRFGAVMIVLALVGLGVASYLLAVRVIGEPPTCGPIKGCETVASSPYATVLGVPVALFGVGFSSILAAASLAWWRMADRRALYAAYGLGLAGLLAVAYLTYLEVAVIGAICIWCVTYAVTIAAGWAIASAAAWLTSDRPPPAG